MGTEKLEYTAKTLAAASAVTRGEAIYCQPNPGLRVQICSWFQGSTKAPWMVSNCRTESVRCAMLPVSFRLYRLALAAVAASRAALVAVSAFCHLPGS